MAKVVVYGADWCGMTQNTLSHLRQRGVDFQYIDIDRDRKAAEWVASENDGKEKKPTVDVDGEVLTQPTNHQLDRVLRSKGLVSQQA